MIQRYSGTEQTDSKTGEETAGKEERQGDGGCLENDAKDEDDTRSDQAPPTTDAISQDGRAKSTEEGTGRQDRDNGR